MTAAILAAQADTQVAISQQVGLVAQLKHIVSELSSRRPAAQKTMLLQALLAENGAAGWHNLREARVALGHQACCFQRRAFGTGVLQRPWQGVCIGRVCVSSGMLIP